MGVHDVTVIGAPPGQEECHQTLLTPEAVQFVGELTSQFEAGVDQVNLLKLHGPIFQNIVSYFMGRITPKMYI